MRRIQDVTALLGIALLLSPSTWAQTANPPTAPGNADASTVRVNKTDWAEGDVTQPTDHAAWLTRNYRTRIVPQINLGNSDRLDQLMKSGNIYLSLNDAIALALENNIDIELQRYGTPIADANILRAQAGGALRGVTPSVIAGPSSAQAQGGGISGIQANAAGQVTGSGGNTTLVQQTGSAIPNLDPYIQGIFRYAHSSSPQANTIVSGTSAYVQNQNAGQFTFNQGFLTGTSYSLGYSDTRSKVNSYSNSINPYRSASLSLNFTQHLLQGFGVSINARNIVIAKNNKESSDLNFRLQVITTVTSVMNLYWDLVSFIDDVNAKKQALAYNERLYEDNKKQVDIGTLAPIEIVRAEAAVASSLQDLIISQTRVLQQETTIKNALSRTGVSTPALAGAHVIPTDRITIPETEQATPIQDLTALALSSRPEVAQDRISVTNARINLKGSKNALLPTFDVTASLGNNGLVGTPNDVTPPLGFPVTAANPYFVGGYGTLLSQLFGRNFPDYSVGVQLNLPIRNRAAQADYVLDEITLRQNQLQLQREENQVRVDVQNAIIGLTQARATYNAAVKQRVLQEQVLDAENKKLKLGASTIFQVILVQRDLANAQSAEVAALSSYTKARVEMERSTGQTLSIHNIAIDQAFKGHVATSPSAVPAQ